MTTETAVRERPILLSGPMVRATLEGRKTRTRRVVKPQPEGEPRPVEDWARAIVPHCGRDRTEAEIAAKAEQLRGTGLFPFAGSRGLYSPSCPYGQPGDRLWVRETWYCDDYRVQKGPYLEVDGARDLLYYRATDEAPNGHCYTGFSGETMDAPWRPSIHMPRWAARLTLEVTGVRVERVQEITEEDARAEGVGNNPGTTWAPFGCTCPPQPYTHRQVFKALWGSLNEQRGYGWDANPWVWVLTFRVLPGAEGEE